MFCFVLHSHFKLLKLDDYQKVASLLMCIFCPVKEENSEVNFLNPSMRIESNKSASFLLRSFREFWKRNEYQIFEKSGTWLKNISCWLSKLHHLSKSNPLFPCFSKGCLCSPTQQPGASLHPSMGQLCAVHGKLTCKPGLQQVPSSAY